MPSIAERKERAQRHVEWGRLVFSWQKQLIEKLTAEGRDTTAADPTLAIDPKAYTRAKI